jgi:hypothetical protein
VGDAGMNEKFLKMTLAISVLIFLKAMEPRIFCFFSRKLARVSVLVDTGAFENFTHFLYMFFVSY